MYKSEDQENKSLGYHIIYFSFYNYPTFSLSHICSFQDLGLNPLWLFDIYETLVLMVDWYLVTPSCLIYYVYGQLNNNAY